MKGRDTAGMPGKTYIFPFYLSILFSGKETPIPPPTAGILGGVFRPIRFMECTIPLLHENGISCSNRPVKKENSRYFQLS